MSEIIAGLPEKCKNCAVYWNVRDKIRESDTVFRKLAKQSMMDLDRGKVGSLVIARATLADEEQQRFQALSDQLTKIGTDNCPGSGNETKRLSLFEFPKICRNPDFGGLVESDSDLKTLNITQDIWEEDR